MRVVPSPRAPGSRRAATLAGPVALLLVVLLLVLPRICLAGSDAWGGKGYSLGTGKGDKADTLATQPLRDALKTAHGWNDAQANAKIALIRTNMTKAIVLAKKSLSAECGKFLQQQFENGNVCVGIGVTVLGYADTDDTAEKKNSEKITIRSGPLCKENLQTYDPELLEVVETMVHEITHTGQDYSGGNAPSKEQLGKVYAGNEVEAHGGNSDRQRELRDLLCNPANVDPNHPLPGGIGEASKCVLMAIAAADSTKRDSIRTALKGAVGAAAQGDSLANNCYAYAKQAFCDFLADTTSPAPIKRDLLKARLNRARWRHFTSWLNDPFFITQVPPRSFNQYSRELEATVPLDTGMDDVFDFMVLQHPVQGPILIVSGVTGGVGQIVVYFKGFSTPQGVFDPFTRQVLLNLPPGFTLGLTLFTDAQPDMDTELPPVGNIYLYEANTGTIYQLQDTNFDDLPDQISPPICGPIPGDYLQFEFQTGSGIPTIIGYPYLDLSRPALTGGETLLVLGDSNHDGYFESQSEPTVDDYLLWAPTFRFDSIGAGSTVLDAFAPPLLFPFQVWATDSTRSFNEPLGTFWGLGLGNAVSVSLSRPLLPGEELVLVDDILEPDLVSPNFTVPDSSIIGVGGVPRELTAVLRVPAPNPMSAQTRIAFELSGAGRASISVFDLQGRKVVTLADGLYDPGPHHVTWSGTDASGRAVAGGVYFIELRTEAGRRTQRVVLVR